MQEAPGSSPGATIRAGCLKGASQLAEKASMTPRGWAIHGLACFAFYLACALWLTWPLGAYVGTGLPNTTSLLFDTLHTAWVLSWQAHGFATAPLSVPQANIYYPSPDALFYGQTAV